MRVAVINTSVLFYKNMRLSGGEDSVFGACEVPLVNSYIL
jgi:hypothetical protein